MDLKWVFGFRASGYARRRAAVDDAIARGQGEAAVELLWKQEREWGLNWANGSPASAVVDFEHLIWVLERLEEMLPEVREAASAVLSPARGLRDLNVMRVSGSPGGRMMSREMAEKMVRMQDELAGARKKLRQCRGKDDLSAALVS